MTTDPTQLERVDVAYVLILDEQGHRVLMVQNEIDWSLPGGKREPGELLPQAAVREVREETGLDAVVDSIVHIQEKFFAIQGHHALFVTFQGRVTGGAITIGQDAEIQRVQWKPISEADALMPWYGGIAGLLTCGARYRFG